MLKFGLAGALLVGLLAGAANAQTPRGAPSVAARPSAADVERVYPPEALKQGLGGVVRLQCKITAEGSMEACKVAAEEPAGAGFGEAAMQLAPLFRMAPQTSTGQSVAGMPVTLPIRFGATQAPAPSQQNLPPISATDPQFRPGLLIPAGATSGQPIVLTSADWAERARAKDIDRSYPPDAFSDVRSGTALLRCLVKADGTLENCGVLDEVPKKAGFGAAALQVSPSFRLHLATHDGVAVAGATVVFAVSYRIGE